MSMKLLSVTIVGLSISGNFGAVAEPCNDGPEPIVAIAPAANGCFDYKGNAIFFAGAFRHGQTITVHMTGEAAESDNSGKITTYETNRNANAEGPQDFYVESTSDDGSLTFSAPKDGTYKISYGPRAMLCADGKVTICVK
jgi:hypothetical protein